MRLLILKNLTAHKMRNKMTSIIFSLSLGFIVFLIVSYNLQISSATLINLKKQGSYIVISSKVTSVGIINPFIMESVISRHLDKIQSFAYVTAQLSRFQQANIKSLQVSDRARINLVNVGVYGVSPGLFTTTINDFLDIDYEQSPLLSGVPLAE